MDRPSLFSKFTSTTPVYFGAPLNERFTEGFQLGPHSMSHAAKHRTYTFPLSLGTVTGTAYWCPQFDGQMISIRIGLKSNDPATNASGTVFDLLLNDTSVFANAGEMPTIATGTTHSPIIIITRGVWVAGDSWAMECKSTGGATGTVTASFEYIGQD